MIVLVKERNEIIRGTYTNLEVKGINQATQKETRQELYSTLSEKWDLIEVGKMIELVMEDKGTPGKPKWQVVDVKAVAGTPVAKAEVKTPVVGMAGVKDEPENEKMTKEDWDKRERKTRKSIERQKSLELAVELAKIKGTDDTAKVIVTAARFEKYLDTGE